MVEQDTGRRLQAGLQGPRSELAGQRPVAVRTVFQESALRAMPKRVKRMLCEQ